MSNKLINEWVRDQAAERKNRSDELLARLEEKVRAGIPAKTKASFKIPQQSSLGERKAALRDRILEKAKEKL